MPKIDLAKWWTTALADLRGIPCEKLGHEKAMEAAWGIGAAAVIAFALSSEVLRYADPAKLAGIGCMAGVAVLAFHTVYVRAGNERYGWLAIALPLFTGAGVLLVVEAFRVTALIDANNQRCAAIEQDMLSAHPRLSNGPDVYQALHCSPGRYDARIFVVPTDREKAAHKALPYGGYPPPGVAVSPSAD